MKASSHTILKSKLTKILLFNMQY